MRVIPFLAIIAVLISLLISYFIYSICALNPDRLLYTIGGFLCFASALVPMMSFKHKDPRIGVNIRALSSLFLVIFIISNTCFIFFRISPPVYILVNGILFLTVIGGLYKLCHVKTC